VTDGHVTAELTLQEAAEELGVHYMTAYRYVRLGRLPAEKVGGVWRVAPSALGDVHVGGEPVPRLTIEGGSRRRTRWADRLEARLIAGDVCGAWNVVEAALTAGAQLDDVYLDVIAPAMVSIGRRWEAGELDVALEHQASGMVLRLIGRLGPRFMRRGRSRGVVVLGAPEGERHALPLALAADLVRAAGWTVVDLGADVPTASFVRTVTRTRSVRAVGVSVTADGSLAAGAETLGALRSACDDLPVLVGGRAIGDEVHARAMGADEWARDGRGLVDALDGLAVSSRR
jgi:excisionase family DNA binding protein